MYISIYVCLFFFFSQEISIVNTEIMTKTERQTISRRQHYGHL